MSPLDLHFLRQDLARLLAAMAAIRDVHTPALMSLEADNAISVARKNIAECIGSLQQIIASAEAAAA